MTKNKKTTDTLSLNNLPKRELFPLVLEVHADLCEGIPSAEDTRWEEHDNKLFVTVVNHAATVVGVYRITPKTIRVSSQNELEEAESAEWSKGYNAACRKLLTKLVTELRKTLPAQDVKKIKEAVFDAVYGDPANDVEVAADDSASTDYFDFLCDAFERTKIKKESAETAAGRCIGPQTLKAVNS